MTNEKAIRAAKGHKKWIKKVVGLEKITKLGARGLLGEKTIVLERVK